jgi:hypothetical protein
MGYFQIITSNNQLRFSQTLKQKGIRETKKHEFFIGNSFTVVATKIFFPKKKYVCLQIGL